MSEIIQKQIFLHKKKDKLNPLIFYASKYNNETKQTCCICDKGYSQTYNIKTKDDDSDVCDSETQELIVICRRCMISNRFDTKVKYRCITCLSFYKLKCHKCCAEVKIKNNILGRIKLLMSKITREDFLKEIKEEIAKL